MTPIPRFTHTLSAALILLAATAPAQANALLLTQPPDNYSWIPGGAGGGSYHEVADDFTATATVHRIVVRAQACSCGSGWITGVVVRFYDWQGGVPTTLLQSETIAAGGPGWTASPTYDVLDLTLQQPFVANGAHAVSVQVLTTINSNFAWGAKTSGGLTTTADAAKHRGSATGTWSVYQSITGSVPRDISFDLWGTTGAPATPSTDPLGIWTEDTVPALPLARHTRLRDLAVVAPDDAWAVGEADVFTTGTNTMQVDVASHWDGTTWTSVPVPAPMPYLNAGHLSLYAVDGTGPNDVWAAGTKLAQDMQGFTDQQVLIVHWDGQQWTEVPAPVTQTGGASVVDIAAIAPNDVWFVGDWTVSTGGLTNVEGLALHWDGSQLTRHTVPGPLLTIGRRLNAVTALASNDVWVAGGGASSGSPSYLTPDPYLAHWNGSSWSWHQVQLATNGHNLIAIDATPTGEVYAIGTATLRFDGSGWQQLPTTSGFDVRALADDLVYVASAAGVRLWDGASWTLVEDFVAYTATGPGSFTLAGIDGDLDAGLLVSGSKLVAGSSAPFAAHLEPHAVDLGLGTAGGAGVPTLGAFGAPVGGQTVRITLAGAAPSALSAIVAGFSRVDLPLLGFTLVPSTDAVLVMSTDSQGGAATSLLWPGGVALSGSNLFWHALVVDPAANLGVAASNALQLRIP